jgi:hypothetical protein
MGGNPDHNKTSTNIKYVQANHLNMNNSSGSSSGSNGGNDSGGNQNSSSPTQSKIDWDF